MLVRSLDQENPREEVMATTSVFLLGGFCGQRNLAGYSCRVGHNLETEHARSAELFTEAQAGPREPAKGGEVGTGLPHDKDSIHGQGRGLTA